MLKPNAGRRVVWQRDEEIHGAQWKTGLIEEGERQSLLLSDETTQLTLPKDTVDELQVLKRIAAMRKFRKEGVQCVPSKHLTNK